MFVECLSQRLTKFIDVFLLNGHPVLLLGLLQSLNDFGPTVVPQLRLGEREGREGYIIWPTLPQTTCPFVCLTYQVVLSHYHPPTFPHVHTAVVATHYNTLQHTVKGLLEECGVPQCRSI